MNANTEKILVAVDGSEQSLNAVRYVSQMIPAANTRVVLFSVTSPVPESFWDQENDPADQAEKEESLKIWAKHHKELVSCALETAKAILQDAGFPEQNITLVSHTRQVGIARDILKESYNGYNAVVVGRSGMGHTSMTQLGSVAEKLAHRVTHTPLVIVGGMPETNRIIVGFDASIGAKKSVSALRHMLRNAEKSIHICYVLRSMNMLSGSFDLFQYSYDQSHFPDYEQHRLSRAEKKMYPELQKAADLLHQAGIPRHLINFRVLVGFDSRARSLVEEAEKKNIGTIVVGRRGLSMVEEFIMGRVAKKIMHQATHHAIWIVS